MLHLVWYCSVSNNPNSFFFAFCYIAYWLFYQLQNEPRHVLRKSIFGVSDTQPGLYCNWGRLEAWNFRFRKNKDCTSYVAKTKALISCAGTAKHICDFVYAFGKFSVFSDRGSSIFEWKLFFPNVIKSKCNKIKRVLISLIFLIQSIKVVLKGWRRHGQACAAPQSWLGFCGLSCMYLLSAYATNRGRRSGRTSPPPARLLIVSP